VCLPGSLQHRLARSGLLSWSARAPSATFASWCQAVAFTTPAIGRPTVSADTIRFSRIADMFLQVGLSRRGPVRKQGLPSSGVGRLLGTSAGRGAVTGAAPGAVRWAASRGAGVSMTSSVQWTIGCRRARAGVATPGTGAGAGAAHNRRRPRRGSWREVGQAGSRIVRAGWAKAAGGTVRLAGRAVCGRTSGPGTHGLQTAAWPVLSSSALTTMVASILAGRAAGACRRPARTGSGPRERIAAAAWPARLRASVLRRAG
jgi:hypothetical protein